MGRPGPQALRRAEQHLCAADPVLARLLETHGPCPLGARPRLGPMGFLVRAIVFQQLSRHAAAAIHARLVVLLGRVSPRPQDVLSHEDAALRGVGLSRGKVATLRDLARKAQDGLPLARLARMDDEAVIAALTTVRGIGRWTAEMVLIFQLGRLDVLPVQDLGIRTAMRRQYRLRELPKPERMSRIAEPWRPYRSVACWYLWRSLD